MIDEPLSELLRRSHPDELLPLCVALGVNPAGLGLDRLVEVLEQTLRRAGASDLGNLLLRGGRGPSYPVLLGALAKRNGIAPAAGVEQTERALLVQWLQRAWEEMSPADRRRAWHHLGLEGDPPARAQDATREAEERLGRGFAYQVGMMAVGGIARLAGLALLPFIGPLAPVAVLLWMSRPRDDRLLPAVLEVSRLRQIVRHRLTVGVLGSPSSGKDAAIQAIFGVTDVNIDPVAGSTRQVTITQVQGATALYLVNTPGMGDVVEEVTEEARQILDHIDIFVYVLNAQGGVQARELADWRACVERRRPALVVVNKVDTLRDEDRSRYLADAQVKLGVSDEDFLAVAFDPLPQLAPGPIGVDAVRVWIEGHLVALGKDPAELPWTGP